MPQNYKVLGQILPTANSLTNVYVTGASTSAVINSIYVCNQSTTNGSFELVIRPTNEALANKHFYTIDSIKAADALIIQLGITMGPDTILAANTLYKTGEVAVANISYNAFGLEIT
jgi:hypothetical protein